jgi:hypothetical protein
VAILKRTPKPDPAQHYRCIMSAETKGGPISLGRTYAGDDPRVASAFMFFLPDNLPGDVYDAAERRLMAGASALPDEPEPRVSSDGYPVGLVTPLSEHDPAGFVVCTEAVGMTGMMNHPHAPVAVGAVVAKGHPAVGRRPKSFRPATVADMAAVK